MSVLPLLRGAAGQAVLRATARPVPVEQITTAATRQLVADMFATMRQEGGIGLAAPQVGVSQQLVVVEYAVLDPPPPPPRLPRRRPAPPTVTPLPAMALFNPRLIVLPPSVRPAAAAAAAAFAGGEGAAAIAAAAAEEQASGPPQKQLKQERQTLFQEPDEAEHVLMWEACLSVPGQWGRVRRAAHVRLEFDDGDGRRRALEARGVLAALLQHEVDHLHGVLYTDRLRPGLDPLCQGSVDLPAAYLRRWPGVVTGSWHFVA